MNRLTACLVVTSMLAISPLAANGAPVYRLEFEGPAGDFISQGQHVLLTQQDVGLFPPVFDDTGDGLVDSVQFISQGIGPLFFILFVDTNKIPGNLIPGFYPEAQRSPFAEVGHPGFWLAWDHRGCNQITGSYTIAEAAFDASGPTRFSVEFQQSCEGFGPLLTGSFEFAADAVPEPPSLILIGAGLAAMFGRALSRRRALARVQSATGSNTGLSEPVHPDKTERS